MLGGFRHDERSCDFSIPLRISLESSMLCRASASFFVFAVQCAPWRGQRRVGQRKGIERLQVRSCREDSRDLSRERILQVQGPEAEQFIDRARMDPMSEWLWETTPGLTQGLATSRILRCAST